MEFAVGEDTASEAVTSFLHRNEFLQLSGTATTDCDENKHIAKPCEL